MPFLFRVYLPPDLTCHSNYQHRSYCEILQLYQHSLMPGFPKSEKNAGGMDWELHWELRALAMIKFFGFPHQFLVRLWAKKRHFWGAGKLIPSAFLLLPAMTVSTLPPVFFPSLSLFLSESDSLHTSMFSLPEFAACVCWGCSSFRTTRTSPDTANPPRYSFKRCFEDLAMVPFLFVCLQHCLTSPFDCHLKVKHT